MAGFEIAGVLGALCAGWLTDRYFRGLGARISVFCMVGCAVSVLLLWQRCRADMLLANTLLLMESGFFVYAPQAMVGVCVANLATKEAAAAAVGLTGLFGYASTVVSGWGMGWVVQHYGWDWAFIVMLAASGGAFALFIAVWMAPRDGYDVIAPRGFPVEVIDQSLRA